MKNTNSKNKSNLPTPDTAKRPGAVGPDYPGDGPANMGSSVTPHVGITKAGSCPYVNDWTFLSCGIDSLDLNVYVNWGDNWKELRYQLQKSRDFAQSISQSVLYSKDLLIYPGGKQPMYFFHLESPGLHLYLNQSGKSASQSNCYASIGSKMLWQDGLDTSLKNLDKLISRLNGQIIQIKPSRLDLCTDFKIPEALSLDLFRRLEVTKTTKTRSIMSSDRLETFYKGSSKGAIQLRVYNKSLELFRSGKIWLLDVWGLKEIEDILDIWRVEFQLRRSALKAYGVNDIKSLKASIGGIWRDLTSNWYCLKLEDDSNVTRRTVLPWWSAVSDCAQKFGAVVDKRRDLSHSRITQAKYYIGRISKLFLSFAALTDSYELVEATDSLAIAIIDHWTHGPRDQSAFLENLRIKQIELAVTPEEKKGHDEISF